MAIVGTGKPVEKMGLAEPLKRPVYTLDQSVEDIDGYGKQKAGQGLTRVRSEGRRMVPDGREESSGG